MESLNFPNHRPITPAQKTAMLTLGLLGLIAGSFMGVAAFGGAINGAVPLAAAGVLIGYAFN